MPNHQPNLRSLLFIIVTLAAIVVLAAGLANFELQPGRPFPFAVPGGDPSGGGSDAPFGGLAALLSWWGLLIVAALVGLVGLWILTFILRPQARAYLLSRLAGYTLLAVLIYALFNALQDRLPTLAREPQPPGEIALSEQPASASETPTLPAFITRPPPWLVTGVTLLVVTLLLVAGWRLWPRQFLRRPASPAELLAREARQAVDSLRRGGNLRDTVLDCYSKMNRLLQEQRGLERPPAMTPREFERHLREVGLADEHIRRLTRLFEHARYSAVTASPQDEDEAVACLSAIVAAYGQPV
ncbi:MAG: DUF4129 domain-containing protein [Chloroflexota bacterium]